MLQYEKARVAWKNPQPDHGGKTAGSSSRDAKSTASTRGKRKKSSEDEGEDVDNGGSRPKRRKPTSSKPASSAKLEVMLAHSWKQDNGPDPTGWWISEKLDGVRYVEQCSPLRNSRVAHAQSNFRAYYNGHSFYSRLNNEFAAPGTFKKGKLVDFTYSRCRQP